MPLFEVSEVKSKHTLKAKEILDHANNIAEMLKDLFLSSRDAFWNISGYTVDDAQKVLDEMDKLSTGSSIASFQMHGAFGQFLNSIVPGALTKAQLESPVPYEIEVTDKGPKIKLVGNKYPTEASSED